MSKRYFSDSSGDDDRPLAERKRKRRIRTEDSEMISMSDLDNSTDTIEFSRNAPANLRVSKIWILFHIFIIYQMNSFEKLFHSFLTIVPHYPMVLEKSQILFIRIVF